MAKTISSKRKLQQLPVPTSRDRILVFSADADLASSLKLLLEDCCEVILETRFEQLGSRIAETSPALLLVDLFSTAQDGLKQLLALEELNIKAPLILMRTYRSSTLMDDAIKRLGAYVLYKPVNVDTVLELVQNLKSAESHSSEEPSKTVRTRRESHGESDA